jgi:ribonuclease BN (tRNA processing enzyme)
MPGFEVIVLGVGDVFSEIHRPTALLLVCDGFHLGVDCPDGYLAALRSASERSGRRLSASAIDHVLITHVHGDHMNGLEGYAFYKHLVEGGRLRLLTSPEVRACIWNQRLSASMGMLWDGQQHRQMGFGDYFEHLPLSWSEPTTVGPFTLRARRTRHHVPTSALLVEAAGRTLGYSSDTSFDPELLAFLEPADLIIHETNLGPAHTPYAALAALPEALRLRMRLAHYPDAFNTACSAIAALHEGDVLQP